MIFDNADWSKLADIAIHIVHHIVWFGDKISSRNIPISMSLAELKEVNFEESSNEVHAKSISNNKSNTYSSSIIADAEAEYKVKCLISDQGSNLRDELIAQRLLKHSAALGRPRNLRRLTPSRDEQEEPMCFGCASSEVWMALPPQNVLNRSCLHVTSLKRMFWAFV